MKKILLSFNLGLAATSFQICFIREFVAQFFGNEINYGLVLGSWLLWGGLGSLAAGRIKKKPGPYAISYLYFFITLLFYLSLLGLRFSNKLLGLVPGEESGLAAALVFALGLTFLISFSLGLAFVLNAHCFDGDSSIVYLYEALGAAAGGLIVHFLVIPYFTNWQAAGISGLTVSILALFSLKPKVRPILAGFALLISFSLASTDSLTQKLAIRPFELIRSQDTIYGKLRILKSAEQYTFTSNSLTVFSYPNKASSEETVHFALLQRDFLRDVLLVGGAASGAAAEVLKYPGVNLDCVELDPAIINLAIHYLPSEVKESLANERTRIFFSDGRAFIKKSSKNYQAIILSLPAPSTAQINRFYTEEFFSEVKKLLSPDGILSFAVPSAENYISDDLRRLLGSLYNSLKFVFPCVEVVPGENNIFLASSSPLNITPEFFSEKIKRLGFDNKFVRPEMLSFRLNSLRRDYLKEKIYFTKARLNRDLVPVSYYFHSILWASQFKGPEENLLRYLTSIPKSWLLDWPIVFIGLILILIRLFKSSSSIKYLAPVAVMGLTAIVFEIVLIMVFQAKFGYVYGKVSLLLGCFMAGLFFGSAAALKLNKLDRKYVLYVQALIVFLVLTAMFAFSMKFPETVPFLFLTAEGILSGYLFILVNKLCLLQSSHPGLAYGMDMAGSFFGAIIVSSIIIPLLGVPELLTRIAALNAICFLFLLSLHLKKAL